MLRARALSCARETMVGERSRPVTCAPRSASQIEYGPEPQPRSRTRAPATSPISRSMTGRSMLSENESAAVVNRSKASPHAFQVFFTSRGIGSDAHHVSFNPIIRCFFGDDHVVNVALAQARRCDPNESRLLMELGDRSAAAIAHSGAQSSNQLVDERSERAFVWDSSFDALGYELGHLELACLAITVAAAFFHRRERAHAAVALERAALEQDYLARAFIRSGEQRSDHHRVRARRDRFADIARVLDPAVGDDRHAGPAGRTRALQY